MAIRKYLILLLLFSSGASYAANGLYFAAEGGIATQSKLSVDTPGVTSITTSHALNAYRIWLGYNHDISTHVGFGLNAGWGQYAQTTYHYSTRSDVNISSQFLEAALVAMLHLTPKIGLDFEMGGGRQQLAVTGASSPTGTAICPKIGVDGVYNFTPHIATIASYSHIFDGTYTSGVWTYPSVDIYMVGLRYTFYS